MDFKKLMKNVKDEATDAVEITKLSAKVSKEKSAVKTAFEEIGKQMYETYRKTNEMPEEYKEQIEKINSSRDKINELNEEIKKIKMTDK